MSRLDILVWDSQITSKLSSSFGTYSYRDLSIDSYSYSYLKSLPKSLFVALKSLPFLCKFIVPTKYHDIDYPSLLSLKSFFYAFRLFLKLVIDLCPILYYNPKLLITYTDNAKRFHLIDCVLYPYIPVLTIQNGSHHYLYQSETGTDFANFFNPPSFHSCFCCLSLMDAELHRRYGWKILESHPVGSVSANCSIKSLSCSIKDHKNPYIFVPLNSNLDRYASKELARYVTSYSRLRSIPLVIGLKIRKDSPRFPLYFEKARRLYGDQVTFNFNYERSGNLTAALNASVVVGCYSTLLREVFSFGVKIYPLNFGPEKLNSHFASLHLQMTPTISGFIAALDRLIDEPCDAYIDTSQTLLKPIGVYPFPRDPITRLSKLISSKLNSFSA